MKKNLILLIIFIYACNTNKKMVKHPLDKSEIRTVVLDNGLKVFLLSDPGFNMSAASVAVQVGSLDNPEDRQGLAHF